MKQMSLRTFLPGFLILISFSCKKGWLDAKSDQRFVVPATLTDFQLLLDNTSIMNDVTPNLGEIGCDDYYLLAIDYSPRSEPDRYCHIWKEGDVFVGTDVNDWSVPYKKIAYSNNVLEGVEKIERTPANQSSWDNVKGSAFFYRAIAFYNIAELFCKPYFASSSTTDLGIILRTKSDINLPSVRSSVEQTYSQIISDLKEARKLLTTTPLYKTRPSLQATFALLARVYLSMEDYGNAKLYADSCLQIQNAILDYNTVSASPTNPFSFSGNVSPEIIFLSRQGSNNMLTGETRKGYVDSTLYQLYASNDKRKNLFFKKIPQTVDGRLAFVGSYIGANFQFSGLATDEIYLIRAECYAREGDKNLAMQDLNTLLDKRWVSQTATDAEDALKKILEERRKELCFRAIRWTDLRRLNKDPRFSKTLTRIINSQVFTLPPNDDRYVYPIPNSEILRSGVPQNPR